MIQVRLAAHGVDVEFQAASGITALFGAAGAGKTVILDAIAGFVTPGSGRIILNDEILFDGASRVNLPPRRRHCGYVARHWALFQHMSLHDNLLFPPADLARRERRRRVKEMMERFGLLEAAQRRPQDVSPAERLRATMARALIGEPKLLLVDEPADGLDIALRAEWQKVLRMVRDETSLPVLMAARDPDTCFDLAGNMLLLDAGRILQSGPPRKVLDQPVGVEAARLLGIRNLFPAEIVALDPGRNTSLLRLENFELAGPYFPGRLRGDRVWLCVEPGELHATAHDGSRPSANQVALRLERASETPWNVRLEFAGGIVAEIARRDFERQRKDNDNKEWLVEFPPHALRVLGCP
ncbi:MAG TPA: ATP-binding cassette domain-containing protein [Bryobacteraceae bacterium]|nr:ATP-binding cassette domain-containing protein [Bryobacteraceae bacterium]